MNCIDYCVKRIMREVDKKLLPKAFRPNRYVGYHDGRSLEERIRQEIVYDYVMLDLNLIGGESLTIPLDGLTPEYVDYGAIYKIPLTMTQGRKIISVHSLDFNYASGQIGDAMSIRNGRALDNAMDAALDSSLGPTPVGNPRIRIVGPNVILTTDRNNVGRRALRCRLENDQELGNITAAHWPYIGDMAVIAAKAYIFNEINVEMGEGSIAPGSINSNLRQTLDNYSDMDELYREYRDTKWRKVMSFNNDGLRNMMHKISIKRL